MSRLLRANFARLWQAKLFWICMGIAGFTGASFLAGQLQLAESIRKSLPDYLVSAAILVKSGGNDVLLVHGIFSVLFLGTEYSNGTIRNKLIVGRTRTEIYFSNLITVAAAGMMMLAARWLITLPIGAVIGLDYTGFASEALLSAAIMLGACVSSGAAITLLGMLVTRKAVIAAIVPVAIVASIVYCDILDAQLRIAEYTEGFEVDENYNVTLTGERIPNPAYVSGARRTVYKAVYNAVPAGQMIQTGRYNDPENRTHLLLFSLGASAVLTLAGILVFRRKDIK